MLFINGSVIFYTLQNFKEFLLCVSACTQIKEEKQYGIEGEIEYKKQTVRRKEKRVWEGGMNERERNSASEDSRKKKTCQKKKHIF
jgi:hypothetical protein